MKSIAVALPPIARYGDPVDGQSVVIYTIHHEGHSLCYSPATRADIFAGLRAGEEAPVAQLMSHCICLEVDADVGEMNQVLLSAIILTLDEERHIGPCLDSVAWADEVIVVDSFSSDRTVEIARGMGARVEQHRFIDWADQRQAAMGMASHPWIFFVDADERATPELAGEIRRVIRSQEYAGYWVPRHNYIFRRLIRHTGWSPDYQPRLLDRRRCRWDPARPVHELVIFDGPDGRLENRLIHYNYDSIAQFRAKQERYTDIAARQLSADGHRARLRSFIGQPAREFIRRYLSLEGYRDGVHGLLLSLLLAYYALRTYAKLWRIQAATRRPRDAPTR